MKLKKILKTMIGSLLIVGTLATVGFLSFTGMLLIAPYIPIAATAFFFAVLIEGEVYKQNIMAGLKKLFAANYFQHLIAIRELKKHLKSEVSLKQSKFLRNYKAQGEFVKLLKSMNADETIIKEEKKRLKMMQRFFSTFLFSSRKLEAKFLTNELKKIISNDDRAKIKSELRSKLWLNRAMTIFYLLAGVSCTFASIHSIHAGSLTLMATLGFSVTPLALLCGVIPLAILAGMGYTMLMYHCVSDIIANDSIQKAIKKFKKFFTYQNNDNKFFFALKVTVLGLIAAGTVSLCIFATVATAGTWWLAVKQGANLLPHLVNAANWIRNICIPAMVIPTFLFNLKNSLDTLKKLGKFSLTRNLKMTWNEIQQTKASENWVQFLNPFRLLIRMIEMPVLLTTFVLHLVSTCVMSDQLEPFPPALTSAFNLANESLTEAHYFMEDGTKKHHDHGTIVNKLLVVLLSPLHFLSSVWQWGFSKENNSFTTVLKHQFNINTKETSSHVLPPAPALSSEWIYQEQMMRMYKENGIKHHPIPFSSFDYGNDGLIEPDKSTSSEQGRNRLILAPTISFFWYKKTPPQTKNNNSDLLYHSSNDCSCYS